LNSQIIRSKFRENPFISSNVIRGKYAQNYKLYFDKKKEIQGKYRMAEKYTED